MRSVFIKCFRQIENKREVKSFTVTQSKKKTVIPKSLFCQAVFFKIALYLWWGCRPRAAVSVGGVSWGRLLLCCVCVWGKRCSDALQQQITVWKSADVVLALCARLELTTFSLLFPACARNSSENLYRSHLTCCICSSICDLALFQKWDKVYLRWMGAFIKWKTVTVVISGVSSNILFPLFEIQRCLTVSTVFPLISSMFTILALPGHFCFYCVILDNQLSTLSLSCPNLVAIWNGN